MGEAFHALRKAMLEARALALPDPTKEFHLFVSEGKELAEGVLDSGTQTLGPWKQPVAFLSKKLDAVATGWLACLRIIAATALLVKDAEKLTLVHFLEVTTP